MKQRLGFKLLAALLISANLLPPALLLAQTSKPAGRVGIVSALKGDVVIVKVLPAAREDLRMRPGCCVEAPDLEPAGRLVCT